MPGCTTGELMGEVRVIRVYQSFQRHSWHLEDPACWRILGVQRHEARPRSTFCASHRVLRLYGRSHWNLLRR